MSARQPWRWVAALALLAAPAWAKDQCTPFDLDPELTMLVQNGRLPDGGLAPDSAACCKEGIACLRRCQPSSQVSQPVDTLTGFAWMDRTDLQATQPWGPAYRFARHYSTAQAELGQGTALGPGWSHTYSASLAVSGAGPATRVQLQDADSGGEEYNWMAAGGYASTRAGRTLTWDPALHLYLAWRDDGRVLVFDESGRLALVRDADGGEVQLRYGGEAACPVSATVPAGALCRVDFLFGRQLHFSHDAQGRLVRVSQDAAGTSPVVTLTHDGAGQLASATRADGRSETYAYGMTHFSWATRVEVSLLVSATDGDGTVVESFGYAFNHDPTDGPARVVFHSTPEDRYTFSWEYLDLASGNVVRRTHVRGTRENLDLTFRNNALTAVCALDAQGNCPVGQLQEFLQAPGLLDDLCEREASGVYTRHQRDSLGRVVGEYTGLTACDALTPEAQAHGLQLGYLGSSSRAVSTAFPTVDPTAPAGFLAFTVADHTLPGSQVDPFCGGAACLQPGAYNQGPVGGTAQREVRVGRTFLDTDGTWGTQVQVTTFTRDGSGRLTAVDGPRRDLADVSTWTWSASSPWAFTSYTEAGHGPVLYAGHDALGRARTVTAENGQVEQLEADPVGRLTSRLQAGRSAPTSWSYTDGGQPAGFTTPEGPVVRYEYQAGLRTAERRFPSADATTEDSRLTTVWSGGKRVLEQSLTGLLESRTWVHAHDGQGRWVGTRQGSGSTGGRGLARDGTGRLVSLSDPGVYDGTAAAPPSHRFTYDPYGGLQQVQRLLQGAWTPVLTVARDARGQPTSSTDARGVTTRYVHDDFGRLVELSSPDLGLRRYVYDEAGNVVRERRPDGVVLAYAYDAADRLVSVSQDGVVLETREVASAAPGVTDCAGGAPLPAPLSPGEVTHVRDASGDWYFGFWPDGRLRYEGRVAPGAGCARTFWWEHDGRGRLTAEVYPSGARLEYAYPADGQPVPDRPTSLTLAMGGQRTALLTELAFTEGELTAYRTSAGRWRLSRRTDGSPSSLIALANGAREQSFSSFDPWRNPGAIQERIDDQETPAQLQTLAHDGLPSLAAASGPGQPPVTFATSATLDRKSAGGVPYCYETGTHRLARVGGALSYRYDPSGAAWQEQRADGSLRTWCYGARGELAATVGAGGEQSQVVMNFRRQRTVERWPLAGLQEDFRVDPASRLRVEAGVASLTALYPRPTREYLWVGMRPVAVVESTEAADGTVTPQGVTLLFSGQLGEVLAETDAAGQVQRQYAFSPFGARTELPSASGEQAVTLNLLSVPPLEGLQGSVNGSPTARAFRIRFTDPAWAGCHVIARGGSGAAVVGEWPQVQAGQLTDWLVGSDAMLTISGCTPPARIAAGVSSQGGTFSTQARSEESSHPYPAAGQQVHLSLPGPGYVHLTGVGVASCDRLEARGPGGQVLWSWRPTGYSVGGFVVPDTDGWTSQLQGEVDLGIWGAGCNATEAQAGFRVAELRLDTAASGLRPPVSLGLPGHKLRADGTLDSWHRLYLPELGRYLQPEPLAAFSAARAEVSPLYGYASQTPLSRTDPSGLYGPVSGCDGWSTALDKARKALGCKDQATRSCECQAKLDECKVCDLCRILSDGYQLETGLKSKLTCDGQPAGGCSTITAYPASGTFKNRKVEFELGLCSKEPATNDNLARAQIHEAVHLCAQFSGRRFPDASKGCSPDAVAAACFPEPKAPDDGFGFLDQP